MRKLMGAILVFLAVLGLAELGARALFPRVPSALESSRNPFRFRGFPEYLRGSEPPADGKTATLVLLSNSQAYAGELPADYGYADKLEKLLTERKVGGFETWQVLNWSSDGMTSIEYVIMAARLQIEPPTVVLAVTGYADYRAAHHSEGFAFCRTDVPLLATTWPVASRIPQSYWQRHFKVEDTLTCFLHERSKLLRFAEYFWSVMDFLYPGAQRLLYSPFMDYHPWEVRVKPRAKPLQLKSGPPQELVFVYDAGSKEMLDEYLVTLKKIPSKVVVVSQPLRVNPNDFRAVWHRQFMGDIAALCEGKGLNYWNLCEALPPDGFITSSHLSGNNHRRFAELLTERVSQLYSPPGKNDAL